jgi:alkanesulfonate monooxygenase SsuD/methylene tetrahydromethanopterin reductase-like flavin-dependent oxidoreductase (luciferase family)
LVIGGRGRKRTLRTVARWADQWDVTYPATPSDWTELDAVMREHCDTVGRDPSTITRSIHLGVGDDSDPSQLADQADTFFAAGVDVVVWSMSGAMNPARLAPLAAALR